MEKRTIKKEEVKWMDTDNATATASCYHGYYSSKRKVPYLGTEYDGNRALCNRHKGIASDEDEFVPFDEVEDNGLKRDEVCKSCLRIYDKLESVSKI